jgi:hypothetical protein
MKPTVRINALLGSLQSLGSYGSLEPTVQCPLILKFIKQLLETYGSNWPRTYGLSLLFVFFCWKPTVPADQKPTVLVAY